MHTASRDAGWRDPAADTMRGETGNVLLDALPAGSRRQCQKAPVELPAGTQLVRQGERITQAFFPTTAVCSISVELASGNRAETAIVGNDGFVGVPLLLAREPRHAAARRLRAGSGIPRQPRGPRTLAQFDRA